MYKFLLLAAFAVVALGASLEPVPIISQDMDIDPEGRFHWSYEGGDGTKQNQEGEVKQVDKDVAINVLRGSFSYVGSDGVTYSVTYTADESGFHAEGAHIPQMPEAIARSIEYLKAHPQKEIK